MLAIRSGHKGSSSIKKIATIIVPPKRPDNERIRARHSIVFCRLSEFETTFVLARSCWPQLGDIISMSAHVVVRDGVV